MLKMKVWSLTFYDRVFFRGFLVQEMNFLGSFIFLKKYLILVFSLSVGSFITLNCQTLEASFVEEDGASPRSISRTMHPGHHRAQDIGDYFNKSELDTHDVESILSLLKDNPQFFNNYLMDTPTEIARNDHYCLKANFKVDPHKFFKKEFEKVTCSKAILSQGQVAFTLSFQVKGGTIGRLHTLTLTVEDTTRSPFQVKKNGKINLTPMPIYYEEKGEQQTPTYFSPKPRSFSLASLKNTLSGKLSSSKNPKEETKQGGNSPNSRKDKSFLSPLFERRRAKTESSSQPQKLTPSSKEEKLEKINESKIFNKAYNNKELMVSPIPVRQKNKTNAAAEKFRRSKSYPNLREDHTIRSVISQRTPLPPRRSVKEIVHEIEKKPSSNGNIQK